MNKAIFLDRDGTLNEDSGYVYKLEDFKLMPLVKEGLRLLQQEDYKLIILSNQSGINRGIFTEQDMARFNAKLLDSLGDVRISKIYVCPHKPDEGCNCRKPGVLNVQKAILEHKLDISKCWIMGDATSDIKLAENCHIKSILVLTGKAGKDGRFCVHPTCVAENMLDAAKRIIDYDNNQDTS